MSSDTNSLLLRGHCNRGSKQEENNHTEAVRCFLESDIGQAA